MRYQLEDVLWQYAPASEGSVQPSGFGQAIMDAFTAADTTNFARLAAAFPEWGVPMEVARFYDGGVEAIREAVRFHTEAVAKGAVPYPSSRRYLIGRARALAAGE